MLTSYYGLNEKELAVVRGGIGRDVLREVIIVVAGNAAGALSKTVEQIQGPVAGSVKEQPKPVNLNSFTALFDFGNAKATNAADGERDSTNSLPSAIRGESEFEKVVRSQAILEPQRWCYGWWPTDKPRVHKLLLTSHLSM